MTYTADGLLFLDKSSYNHWLEIPEGKRKEAIDFMKKQDKYREEYEKELEREQKGQDSETRRVSIHLIAISLIISLLECIDQHKVSHFFAYLFLAPCIWESILLLAYRHQLSASQKYNAEINGYVFATVHLVRVYIVGATKSTEGGTRISYQRISTKPYDKIVLETEINEETYEYIKEHNEKFICLMQRDFALAYRRAHIKSISTEKGEIDL